MSHGGGGEENVLDMATRQFNSVVETVIPAGHSYRDKENRCYTLFNECCGPFLHLHSANNHPIIFQDEEDYRFAMNAVAMCAFDIPFVRIITFILMSNHVHFVMYGADAAINNFFDLFKGRLKRYFAGKHTGTNLNQFIGTTVGIYTLESLRNQICYTNRNNYVVDPDHTPFTYPYGAGNCFFMPVNKNRADRRFGELSFKEKRAMLHSHNIDYPENLAVVDGYITSANYCEIRLGEDMFRDARHYFFKVSRDIEGYKEIADELDDAVFYTDDELNAVLWKICKERYDGMKASLLPQKAKTELAKTLHYDYNADNDKIVRMLQMTSETVNALFPMRK